MSSNTASFDTRATAATAAVEVIWVGGYAQPGDGGAALYKKLAAAPSPVKAWQFQSADGVWWELAERFPNPGMFGAVGDGTADDSAAVQAALAYADNILIDARYGLSSAVELGPKQSLDGTGMSKCGFVLNHVDAKLAVGTVPNASSITLNNFSIDGNDVASTCLEFLTEWTGNSSLRDIRLQDFKDYGLKIGVQTDQLTLDRALIGPAKASEATSHALHLEGPGPIYVTNSNIDATNGVGVWSDYRCTLVNTRINFHVNGLIAFHPVSASNVMTLYGAFLENVGLSDGGESVPVGSPVAVLCDGANGAGGIVIDSPQNVQSGWGSVMFKAINGGWISIDCRQPWTGNVFESMRALTAIQAGGDQADGSYVELHGPWRYDDWDNVTKLTKAYPQTNGYPIRLGGGWGQRSAWVGDLSTTAGWSTVGNVSGLAVGADGHSLDFTCTGTAAEIDYVIPAAELTAYVGKAILLRATMSATGSEQLAMCIRLSGAGVDKTGSDPSWGESDGYDVLTYHCTSAVVTSASDLTIKVFGNNNGDKGSTADVTLHSIELIVFDSDAFATF